MPIFLAVYAAYPYLALYRLGEALRTHDLDAVETKVDWVRLRQGVKDDVNAALVAKVMPEDGDSFAAFGLALAGKLASPVVDASITPTSLAAVATADRPTLTALITRIYVSTSPDKPLPQLVGSSFDGLTTFEATAMPRGAEGEGRAIRLRFELEGGYWTLTRIHLPVN